MPNFSKSFCVAVLGFAGVSTLPAAVIARWNANNLALADGAPVSSWVSTVGGQNLANATGTAQPTYRNGGTNGRPSVDFDGNSDFLSTSAAINGVGSVFLVATADTGGANLMGVISNGADSRNIRVDGTSSFYRSEGHGGDNNEFYRADGGVTGNDGVYVNNILSGGFTRDVPHVVGSLSDSLQNYTDFYVGTATSNPVNPAFGRWWDGDVSEIIVFGNTLDATERAGVSSILSFNWGISPTVTATAPEVAAANALGIFAVVVPEPSLPLLLAFGLTGFMWRRRRA